MYAAMAAIVERVSGTKFEEFVTSRIFEPLNMTSTTYNATAAQEGGHLAQAFGAVDIHAKHGGEGHLNITYHGLPFFIRPELKVMSGEFLYLHSAQEHISTVGQDLGGCFPTLTIS